MEQLTINENVSSIIRISMSMMRSWYSLSTDFMVRPISRSMRCVVERITYQNEENGYTVLKCAVKNYSDLVTVVGTMPDTHVGSVLSLDGFWKMNARYGRQFCAERFEETLPATVYGIEKYLGSGLVKGIGPVFARKIVEKFGENTLDIIDETPEELIKKYAEIPDQQNIIESY